MKTLLCLLLLCTTAQAQYSITEIPAVTTLSGSDFFQQSMAPPAGFIAATTLAENGSGVLVGDAEWPAGCYAMIWANGTAMNLNGLISDATISLYDAYAIGNDGRILASGLGADSRNSIDFKQYLLTPLTQGSLSAAKAPELSGDGAAITLFAGLVLVALGRRTAEK